MNQITTHILDTSEGRPASGVAIALFQEIENHWSEIGTAVTNADGRIDQWTPSDAISLEVYDTGIYKLVFQTMPYFHKNGTTSFYPYIEIVFSIAGDGQHYHVPLLLNPFGYSTYRGS